MKLRWTRPALAEIYRSVFAFQEKVIQDILRSEEERRALEAAPRSVDPIQQTVATAIQSYLNHPEESRHEAIEAIRFLNQPMLRIQMQRLRQAYRGFQNSGSVRALLEAIDEERKAVGNTQPVTENPERTAQITREDLKLICFDILS